MTYHQAIVAKIKKDYVIVIDQTGRFLKLKTKPDLQVGQTIYYLDEDIYQGVSQRRPISKLPFGPMARNMLLIAATLLLMIGGRYLFQASNHRQVAAAMNIGISDSLAIEMNDKGEIIQIHSDSDSLDDCIGKPFTECYPALRDYIAKTDQEDLVIAYSDKLEEKDLVKELSDGHEGPNLVFTQGDLSDYKAAQDRHQTYSQYLIQENGIDLWTPDEGRKLTAEEKQERLGSKAHFYQVMPDEVARRRQMVYHQINIGDRNLKHRMKGTSFTSRQSLKLNYLNLQKDWEESEESSLEESYQTPNPLRDDDWDDDDDDWDDDDWDDDYDEYADDWDDYDDDWEDYEDDDDYEDYDEDWDDDGDFDDD